MEHISYFEAWDHWVNGNLSSQTKLWGLSLFWWGRIGKMLQFFGGVTVIAEIIGVAKLQKFGKSLHNVFTITKVKQQIADCFYFMRAMIKFFLSKKEDNDRLMDEANKFKASNFSVVLTMIMVPIISYELFITKVWWEAILYTILGFTLSVYFISPILVLFGILFLSLIGFLVDILIIEPFAKLIDNERADKTIKLVALILFLVGFHFDLLAS